MGRAETDDIRLGLRTRGKLLPSTVILRICHHEKGMSTHIVIMRFEQLVASKLRVCSCGNQNI